MKTLRAYENTSIYKTKNLAAYYSIALSLRALISISIYTLIRVAIYEQVSDTLLPIFPAVKRCFLKNSLTSDLALRARVLMLD
ncbi:MAG: hypothetical protein CMD96_06750 [Gammaproteobacteria bacterium]|jgi:hypothetical protein|nr:hypothetical protein [Gammaproteobacteria bacterium]|tara:strand:- start:31112 stop:31360 length:249 start_codon:yes stop_codon:yes gene_type:complete